MPCLDIPPVNLLKIDDIRARGRTQFYFLPYTWEMKNTAVVIKDDAPLSDIHVTETDSGDADAKRGF